MRKLTDEELSRVLSMQAIGKLDHTWYYSEDTGCNCVAGAALEIGVWFSFEIADYDERARAQEVSRAVGEDLGTVYPRTPEALLAYLAERGLA